MEMVKSRQAARGGRMKGRILQGKAGDMKCSEGENYFRRGPVDSKGKRVF